MNTKEINLNNALRDFKPEKVTGGLTLAVIFWWLT